jgi:probable rRNA maturation factor
MGQMKIKYINTKEWKVDSRKFAPFVKRLSKHFKSSKGAINCVFVDDEYIQALNKAYRGKDKPTDVLSFDYKNDKNKRTNNLIGELYISMETALKQAKKQKISIQEELNKLFVHGILHIHGFDHIKDKDYIRMRSVECDILQMDLPMILGPHD